LTPEESLVSNSDTSCDVGGPWSVNISRRHMQ